MHGLHADTPHRFVNDVANVCLRVRGAPHTALGGMAQSSLQVAFGKGLPLHMVENYIKLCLVAPNRSGNLIQLGCGTTVNTAEIHPRDTRGCLMMLNDWCYWAMFLCHTYVPGIYHRCFAAAKVQ